MERIIATTRLAFARQQDVTVEEAIRFLISKFGGLRPTEMLDNLCDVFVPHFEEGEAKEAFSKMMESGELVLTPDRFLRFKEESR